MTDVTSVLVVGGGVAGLTCALELLDAGYSVQVAARELLGETTSAVAAAFWYPYRAYPEDQVNGWAHASLRRFMGLADDPHTGVLRRETIELGPIASRPGSHLRQLEAESIHILREVVAEFERPVMLYSIGKDSSRAMLRLAREGVRAGAAAVPAPAHRHHRGSSARCTTFRDAFLRERGARPRSCTPTRTALAEGINPFDFTANNTRGDEDPGAGAGAARRAATTPRSAARAATRSARAPRSGSTRSAIATMQWDPKNQRPELWNLYNGKVNPGESIRVFPLSNWTELDVWQYILVEQHPGRAAVLREAPRPVVERDGALIMVDDERMRLRPGRGAAVMRTVRFRTLGCYPLTGAIELDRDRRPGDHRRDAGRRALSERQGRLIDHDEDGSMEQKKREGYF
jgi:sulfate adenylyltransferase subunit 2